MLSEISMQLELPEGYRLNQNKSSLFQGAMMELLDYDYANQMHIDGVKPYSQSLILSKEGNWMWNVRVLNEEAYEKIGLNLLSDDFKVINIKHDGVKIPIVKKNEEKTSIEELNKTFFNNDSSGIFRVNFLSPTAFKVDGYYQFYPDIFHIYQSLMIRQGISGEIDTLNALVEKSRIVSYKLHDERFGLEGVKIPSFKGEIVIKVNGPQTLKNYAKLLLEFGCFSGIGIKTSIGMGYIRMEEKELR